MAGRMNDAAEHSDGREVRRKYDHHDATCMVCHGTGFAKGWTAQWGNDPEREVCWFCDGEGVFPGAVE